MRANSAGQQATGFQDRRGPKGATFKVLPAERSRRIKCCRGLRTSIFSQRTAAKKPRDVVALRPRKESLRVKGPSHSNALTSGLGWINRAIMSDSLQKKESRRKLRPVRPRRRQHAAQRDEIAMLRLWTRTCHRRQ